MALSIGTDLLGRGIGSFRGGENNAGSGALGALGSLIGLDSGGVTKKDFVAKVHKNEAVIPLDKLPALMDRVDRRRGRGDVTVVLDPRHVFDEGWRSNPRAARGILGHRHPTSTREYRARRDGR